MIVVPFQKYHIDQIVVQEKQQDKFPHMTEEMKESLTREASFTGIDEDGTILAIAGIMPLSDCRCFAWSYLSGNLKHKLVPLTKVVKRYLDTVPYHRIEMHVECDFAQGHRWAKMLGFEMECERMRHVTPDRRDMALYALVKE